MIIELNTKLLDYPDKLNLNQLVFLSMVLDKNQKANNQDVRKIVSLISDDEISYLIEQGLITSIEGIQLHIKNLTSLQLISNQIVAILISFTICTQFMLFVQMEKKSILERIRINAEIFTTPMLVKAIPKLDILINA